VGERRGHFIEYTVGSSRNAKYEVRRSLAKSDSLQRSMAMTTTTYN